MYDVVFEGCTVVDGSGGRGYAADVAVQDGRIAAVGNLAHAEADRRVNGTGKVLAPGFIDMHTHSDLPLLVNPRAESKIRQGVTTEVIGNCGLGPAPLTEKSRAEMRESSTFLAKGSEELGWDWLRFGDYLNTMAENGVALNVVPLVGHTALRMAAMGMDRRPAEPAEIAHQQQLLRESLEDGAFGMSSGLIYPPSAYSDTEELVSLADTTSATSGARATRCCAPLPRRSKLESGATSPCKLRTIRRPASTIGAKCGKRPDTANAPKTVT